MRKGTRVTIRTEEKWSGVIMASLMTAKVVTVQGDNITVKGADGCIYEIDRNIRHDDGAYIVQ